MTTFIDKGQPIRLPARRDAEVEDRPDPEMVGAVDVLLRTVTPADGLFASEVQRLEQTHGNVVYSELIYMLTHRRFGPDAARYHWGRILERRNSMQRRLRTPVDLRVALASYFIEVNGFLENPKLIELELFERIRDADLEDELTGLCSRRLFERHLVREIRAARRRTDPLSLIAIDVDDWNAYAEHAGSEGAGEALAAIAGMLLACLRESDFAARLGDDEFALILSATSKIGAAMVARRALEAVANHAFPGEARQPNGNLTVSIGLATYPADARDADGLLDGARRAAYTAKARGKNQVCLHGHDRRSYARTAVVLEGELAVSPSETCALAICDLSEDGLLGLVGQGLPVGGLVEIRLMLPGSGRELAATGRVVRVTEKSAGQYETAIRAVHIQPADRELLLRFLRSDEAGTA